MRVHFVIGGASHERALAGGENLRAVIEAVANDMGVVVTDLEARNTEGKLFNQYQQIAPQIAHSEKVFLQPRAGVSG